MIPPQIGISYVENMAGQPLEDFFDAVQCPGLDLRREVREGPELYAGLEWLMPTAVFIYISKSYFDAFLTEAGTDHYHLLKAAIKKLTAKLTGPSAPVGRLYFSGEKKVESPIPKYSLVYSVIAELGPGLSAKPLLQPDLSADECNTAVDLFTQFLDSVFAGTFDSSSVKGIEGAEPISGLVLLAYDKEQKKLEVKDPRPPRTPIA